ncbi:MAG: hypothetical protein IKS45_12585, partial [Thermoguttaceae bacterium]|nr:hypothetical protein [Thermoguttaceae bacterium]
MAPLLQQFTLPKTNFIGLFFNQKRQQILSDFLSDADDYWFVSEERQDKETNKLFPLSEIDAKIALQNNVTVTKISKKTFSVKLHYEELRLSDGESLTLNINVRVKISDPVRFYSRFLEQFGYNDSIQDGDSLHSLWEMPFQNVLQVETHKVDYPSWKTRLVGPAIFTAIKTMYYAPMAAKYVDGTELELVESVEGYSPSVEKRLEDENKALEEQRAKIEKEQAAQEEERKAILEKEKLIITHAQDQEKRKAELEILKEQNHSKELEIEAQKAKN